MIKISVPFNNIYWLIFIRLHDEICKSPDFLNIRILKLFVYSQRPKIERLDFGQCWNPNDQLFGMVLFGFRTFGTKAILFGIQTFGFQSFGDLVPIVWNPNVWIIPKKYPDAIYVFKTHRLHRDIFFWPSDGLTHSLKTKPRWLFGQIS